MAKPVSKQIESLVSSQIIQETDLKLMTDAEEAVLANLVIKGILGVRIYNVQTPSISAPQVATRDYRTAARTFTFPEQLSAIPVAIIGIVNNNYGCFTVTITDKSATSLTYRINNSISNTSRVYNLTFVVFY